MRPKYLQSATHQRDRWMVSYADVLTILLIFFVVAAAKSLEVPRAHTVVPVQPVIGHAEAELPRTNLIRAQERLREHGLEPKLEPRGLVISLPQVILFSSGEDTVSPQALPTIAQIADVLRELPNDVRLIGYADPVPIHNRRFRSNWELSAARSIALMEMFTDDLALPHDRMSIAGFADTAPVASNETVEGRARNRRVDIVVLTVEGALGEPAHYPDKH